MTRQNWYWDMNIAYSKIKEILKREDDPRFPRLAGTLLARVQDPKEVFGLITHLAFCRRYQAIENEIKSDEWTKEKAAFWKSTFLRLSKELKEKGERIRRPAKIEIDFFDKQMIETVKRCRRNALVSQKELADLMGYSQQYISGIETGREKITPEFLKKLAKASNQKIDLDLSLLFNKEGRELLTEAYQMVTSALSGIGVKTEAFDEEILGFTVKVAFLLHTGRHEYLRKRISKGWTDKEKLAGDAFEIHFAYSFEDKHRQLQHEVKVLQGSDSSIDFQYQASLGKTFNFELVNVFEREWIRREMDKDIWKVLLSSDSGMKKEDPRSESIFVQQKIREKVQRWEGNRIAPIKFNIPGLNDINVIVANVTFVHMGMFDTKDAIEIVLGATHVEPQYRLGILGLTGNLPSGILESDPFKLEEASRLNEIFQSRIHFVLFAWDTRQSNRFIDSKYRYFNVPNPRLVSQEILDYFNKEMETVFKRQ